MPNDTGLGGSDLYNILKGAQENNFNSDKFSVANSAADQSVVPGSIKKAFNPSFSPKLNIGTNMVKNLSLNQNNRQVTGLDTSKYTKGLSQNLRFDKLPNFPSIGGASAYDASGTQYDMFERNSYGNVVNTVGIESETGGAQSPLPNPSNSIDNKLIINYKNTVGIDIVPVNGKNVFVNKVIPYSKYKNVNYKDPSIDKIVNELSENPASRISYADFLYCKKLGAFPNNRLVILRRFFQPVDDDLFGSSFNNKNQNPLSVMVTWFDEFPLRITYGENWESFGNGIVQEFSNTFTSLTSGFFDKNKVLNGIFGIGSQNDTTTSTDISYPWLKVLWYQFVDKLYKNNSSNIPPHFQNVLTEANPNLIRKSVIKTGLQFQLRSDLTFSYTMRYINGIDPHVAMHNIIANAIRMGTSTSVTIFPKYSTAVPDFVKNLNEGKIVTALSNVLTELGDFLTKQAGEVANALKNVSVADFKQSATNFKADNLQGQYTRQLFSLYRFRLTAALQADMGLPSGIWHLTVGNPFNPIASVGDLVIKEQMSMSYGKELSYDDQPTEVTFTISLESARPRGAQEIEQIFNAGRGRIYVYPKLEDDPDLYLSDENPAQVKTK